MKNSKKFIAALCALSFIVCAFVSAQEAVGASSDSQEKIEQSQLINQTKIDETMYTLDGAGTTGEAGSETSSSPLRTVWVFFRMILVLAIVLAIIWIIFKLMKMSVDPEKSNDEFLRKVSSLTISP